MRGCDYRRRRWPGTDRRSVKITREKPESVTERGGFYLWHDLVPVRVSGQIPVPLDPGREDRILQQRVPVCNNGTGMFEPLPQS